MVSFQELEKLSISGLYKMNHIEWWLMKYEEEYFQSKKRVNEKDLDEIKLIESGNYRKEILNKSFDLGCKPENLIGRKPIDLETLIYKDFKNDKILVDCYEKLNELSIFYKYEKLAKEKLLEYDLVKDDKKKKESWMKENKDFGFKVCLELFVNYLDKTDKRFFINPLKQNYYNFQLYIDIREFHNLIHLSLFYTKEVEYWFDEIKYLYGIKELFNFSN